MLIFGSIKEIPMHDMLKNNRQRSWWDKKVILGMTRNQLMFIIIGLAMVVVYSRFINWDWVFGLR